MKGNSYKVLVAVAVLGLVVGTWGMVERLLYGLNPVAFGSYVPWGLWVAFYLLFLGFSAGAFLLTIMVYLFQMKRFQRVGRLSAFTVLVALICETLFVLLDLGQISRFYQFLLTPSFSSLMTWMFVLFAAMLIVYALETFFLVRGDLIAWSNDPDRKGRKLYRALALGASAHDEGDRVRDAGRVRILSLISLPVGFLFYATNGAFFAIVMNRPIWNSSVTPALFVVAAMLSGGALITWLIHVFMHDDELVTSLGGVVLFLLVTFLLLEGLRFFVGYWSGLLAAVASLDLVVSGPYWWTFWIVHLGIGSLLPLILLTGYRENTSAVAWACFLIVIAFLAFRLNFLIPDLQITKLLGMENAFVNKRLQAHYIPNLNEWLVSLWVVSLGLLTFLLGTRWLPVVTSNRGGLENAE